MLKVICIGIILTLLLFPQNLFNDLNHDMRFVNSHDIYIINYAMHTGIIIMVDELRRESIQAVSRFSNYRFIDIGWGDEEFYQGNNSLMSAARAIFVPTPSVVRIEGYNTSIQSMIPWCNYIIKLSVNDSGFHELCRFINASFKLDQGTKVIIASVEQDGKIIFFKSGLSYHLNNTCNTWVAKALLKSGFKVNPHGVRTASGLFKVIEKLGEVIKSE